MLILLADGGGVTFIFAGVDFVDFIFVDCECRHVVSVNDVFPRRSVNHETGGIRSKFFLWSEGSL
jgi:hypothetical protein